MINTSELLAGISLLLNWQIPLAILGGMILGLVIGVIPGVTAAIGLAVVLPLTFKLDALTALTLMTSVYTGSLTGGGILAILVNTPGTPGAVATTFDGYPMTRQGRHNEALGMQIAASVIGGFLSYLALLLFIQPMTWLALQFGPSEMLALTVLVLLVVGMLHGRSFARSLFAGVLGLMLSTIGTALSNGVPRGTMGFVELEDGLPLVLCVIGMFAVPELIDLVARKSITDMQPKAAHDFGRLLNGVRVTFLRWKTWSWASAIGVFVGLLPAAGATLASLLSYSIARRHARPEQRFGEGEPDGVVAAESANNASEGGAMAILLSLGIPGSASTAVILGAFMLHGLVPGGGLFRDNGALVYGLIAGNLVQTLMLGFFALLVAYSVARVVVVPTKILVPVLIIVISLGAYSFRNLTFDVFLLYTFGVGGWLFKRHHFPLVSVMIGLFLGRQLDEEMVRLHALFGEDPLAALGRPITLAFTAMIVFTIAWQIHHALRRGRT